MRYVVQVYAAVDPEDSESGDSKALALNWVWLLISFTELCTMPARTQFYLNLWPASSKILHQALGSMTGATQISIKCLGSEEADDTFWLGKLNEPTTEIRNFAIEEGCTTEEAPVYYNLALDDTPVESIYRENYLDLQATREGSDPQKLMNLIGGFRIV